MSRSASARSVFVGNIPYSATEQELEDVFRTVGNVVSFRLVKNSDGQPKGFGFCEFRDAQTAESAIRNLNNYDFHGRSLRIDYADKMGNDKDKQPGGGGGDDGGARGRGGGGQRGTQSSINSIEIVNGVVKNMPPERMYEVLGQLKTMCVQNRENARELFASHPHLALAVMRMQERLSTQSFKNDAQTTHNFHLLERLQSINSGGGRGGGGGGMAHDRPHDRGMGMGPGMRGPDMRGPDMRGPDLRGPDLRGPDLRGPDMGPVGMGPGGMRDGPGGMGGGPGMGPPPGMGVPPGMGGPPGHMMDMGMSRPYDDGPSVQPPYHGGPGSYGPGPNMGGPAGMAPPAIGPPPGMSGPGPQHMGGAPPPQTHSILNNLTPQQREQFQKLINSTPEQLNQMPPHVKSQVLALQAQVLGGR